MISETRKNATRSFLGKTVHIKIDRPLGSTHPKHQNIVYPVNYGYLPYIIGGDEEEMDVYLLGVGIPVKEYTANIIAVIYRHDDDEDKLVAAPLGVRFTAEDIRKATAFQEQYFDSEIEIL